MRKPLLGVTVLLVTLAGQPLARTVNRGVLVTGGDWAFWGFLVMGLLGILLVAAFLHREELSASLAGYAGGLLIWHGFSEGCLRYFETQFQVPAVDYGGFPLSGRYALLMSTLTIMLGVFTVYGLLNRETRCNFMRWILRRLHWSPGDPTPGYRRSYARIAAMETIFIQWAVFILFLYLGPWGNSFYLAMLVWSVYLLWRLSLIPRRGMALRYAIPIAIILFSLVEVFAFFGVYPEYWKNVIEYPIANLLTVSAFFGGIWFLLSGTPNARA